MITFKKFIFHEPQQQLLGTVGIIAALAVTSQIKFQEFKAIRVPWHVKLCMQYMCIQ